MDLRGIAFDAFGTLFDLGSLADAAGRIAGDRGGELAQALPGRLIPLTWHVTAAGVYRPLPELATTALSSAARELEVPLDGGEAEEIAAGLTSLRPYPDAAEALDQLGRMPLTILSNGTRDGVTALAESAGIADRLDHFLVADDVGRYKPAPEVYGLAPEAFRCDPDRVLLVSGNEWDVAGAQLAGLRGCLIARGRPMTGFAGCEPDLVCSELRDLPAAIASSVAG